MKGLGGHSGVRSRYELESELGRGAGGVVYSARARADGRIVAIKLGRPRTPGAAHAESLEHEHLVTVLEHGTHENLAYVVMERVDGTDLTRYCSRETRLPIDVTIAMMTCIARALAFLHDRGIVHGDVKPGNVLYSQSEGVVKLADLPAACPTGVAARGTPAYLAPEQVCGEASSAAADQFAFGVTLYELACGMLPFAAASLPQLHFAIAHEPAADIRQHDPALPEALGVLLRRALAKDPAQRFPTMHALAEAMEGLGAGRTSESGLAA